MYLFSCISLSEISFSICYYIKTNYTKHENNKISTNDSLIKNLNIIMIFLIIANSIVVKYNIFSPIELQIFYDKNKKIINSIYILLYFSIFLCLLFQSLFSIRRK